MVKTMIQIKATTRDKIKSLGKMGDSYDVIINKLYNIAVKSQMRNYLMDTVGYVDVDDLI